MLGGLAVGLAAVTKAQAHALITQPVGSHTVPDKSPADYGLPFEEASATSADGIRLAGWYIPGKNRAVVIAQHGYKNNRGEMLDEAVMFHRHGYGVLVSSVRAHDRSGGERISFGHEEMADLQAWYDYLLRRTDVDSLRIGALGHSMGGFLVIQYAALNPGIRAVVAVSAFSSLHDTVSRSVQFFTGLPSFPFAPLILFWAEREAGFPSAEIDGTRWIGRISPRPVFLMQGGADDVISPGSGRLLYDAAGEPRELWFEPDIGHVRFFAKMPAAYEKRVVGFLNRYLLGP